MKKRLIFLAAAGFLAAGSLTHAAPKPTFERGWIGGEYEMAKRSLIPSGCGSAVSVKQVYAETPASQAGLQAGELITAVNGRPVSDLRSFRRLVDAATPGGRATISALRNGQSLDLPLTIGREKNRRWHALSFGLRASSQFDLWPNPDFTLLPLVQYQRPQKRVELHSPEVTLAKQKAGARSKEEAGMPSEEGWDVWVVLFGLTAHKQILSQEIVPSSTAMQ